MTNRNIVFIIIMRPFIVIWKLNEEELEQIDKYVLKIFMFNDDMNGEYGVYCGNDLRYTDVVTVEIKAPPSNVKLEVHFDEERLNQMYAVCTVYDSNPVCEVQLRATGEVIGPERYTRNYSLPHGAWNAEYAVDLNVSKKDNGRDITCVVRCKDFSLNLTDTVSIQLPYPPLIKFNISGSVLSIAEGKQVYVDCLAESVPASNISWIEELSNGNVTEKQCNMASNCDFSIDADTVSKRRFICSTQYLTSSDRKHLTVNILEKTAEKEGRKRIEQASNKLVIWIILGSCLLVGGIIIAVVLFVVIRKRRQNLSIDKDRHNRSKEQISDVDNVQELFGHNIKCKDSGDDQISGNDQHTDLDHVSGNDQYTNLDHVSGSDQYTNLDHVSGNDQYTNLDQISGNDQYTGLHHVSSNDQHIGLDHVSGIDQYTGMDHVSGNDQYTGLDHVTCNDHYTNLNHRSGNDQYTNLDHVSGIDQYTELDHIFQGKEQPDDSDEMI